MPGDPLFEYLGEAPTPEQIAKIREELGIDKPLYEQYCIYLWRLVHGDMGWSYSTRHRVFDDIIERFSATVELAVMSFLIIVIIGFPLGIACALRKEGPIDTLGRVVVLVGAGMPSFWLAIVLQILLYLFLGIAPVGGRISIYTSLHHPVRSISGLYVLDSILTGNTTAFVDSIRHLFLPSVVLSTRGLAIVTRMTRASMLEVMSEEYVRNARALGISERLVVWKYALRNTLVEGLTVLGIVTGLLLRGAVLVETVFDWPGLGSYMVNSISSLDYPAITGTGIFITLVYVTTNYAIDLLYKVVDPRIEY